MRGVRAAILAIALVGAFSSPVSARDFSAFNVLTVCLTTRSDPDSVTARFIAEGWEPVIPEPGGPEWISLGVAMLAQSVGFERNYTEQSEQANWDDAWARAQQSLEPLTKSAADKRATILREPVSRALLVVSTGEGPMKRIHCTLAVPATVTRNQSYHPKLESPNLSSAFLAKIDTTEMLTTLTEIFSISVSVDPEIVNRKLGSETDVAAVFSVIIRYPTWAVAP